MEPNLDSTLGKTQLCGELGLTRKEQFTDSSLIKMKRNNFDLNKTKLYPNNSPSDCDVFVEAIFLRVRDAGSLSRQRGTCHEFGFEDTKIPGLVYENFFFDFSENEKLTFSEGPTGHLSMSVPLRVALLHCPSSEIKF